MVSSWNETARLADLVLPAATFLESWNISQGFSSAEDISWINLQQPAVKSGGESRMLEEVLLQLADNLGGDLRKALPYKRVQQFYEGLWQDGHVAVRGKGSFPAMMQRGFSIPGGQAGTDQPGTAGAGKTAQGIDPDEKIREMAAYFSLVHMHTMTRNNSGEKVLVLYASSIKGEGVPDCKWLEEISHALPVWMHPAAAKEIGCDDGDWVFVQGPAGRIKTRVKLTSGLHPEVAAMESTPGNYLQRDSSGMEDKGVSDPDTALVWWKGDSFGENVRRIIPWPENPHEEAPPWEGTRVTISRAGRG